MEKLKQQIDNFFRDIRKKIKENKSSTLSKEVNNLFIAINESKLTNSEKLELVKVIIQKYNGQHQKLIKNSKEKDRDLLEQYNGAHILLNQWETKIENKKNSSIML